MKKPEIKPLIVKIERGRSLFLGMCDRPYAATRRVHGCLIHLDIIDGKIWIQRDGTEEGVGTELISAGIPKNRIALGFRSPELRQDTEESDRIKAFCKNQ